MTKNNVTRWYQVVQGIVSVQETPHATVAEVLAHIDAESGGLSVEAYLPNPNYPAATGLLQIIPDNLRTNTPLWLRRRPDAHALLDPAVNVAYSVYMMTAAMHDAANFDDHWDRDTLWRRALLQYYTGTFTNAGWNRRPPNSPPGAKDSGANYVNKITQLRKDYARWVFRKKILGRLMG